MIKLEIKNQDGSTYWTEHFNDQASCDKWLAEEKTRAYWKSSFTLNVVDNSIDEKAKQEAAKKDAQEKADAKAILAEEIKEGKGKGNRSLSEVNELLDKLVNYLGL